MGWDVEKPESNREWLGATICNWLAGKISERIESKREPGQPEQVRDEIAATYLGDGRIRIGQKTFILTTTRFRRFIEGMANKNGGALTGDLQDRGVTNPAEVAKMLQNWEGGILAPYLTLPGGKENKGYATTIKDGRDNN